MAFLNKFYLYDKLFEKSKIIMDKYNPCQFNKETSLCIRDTLRKERGEKYSICGCCGSVYGNINSERCQHFDEGCTVKSLSCKTWLCDVALHNLPRKAKIELYKIEEEAKKENLWVIRASKEKTLSFFKKL